MVGHDDGAAEDHFFLVVVEAMFENIVADGFGEEHAMMRVEGDEERLAGAHEVGEVSSVHAFVHIQARCIRGVAIDQWPVEGH